VASCEGPHGRAVEDSVVKGVGSLPTSLACVGFGAIPRGMALKVDFARSNRVNSTQVELVETHERMGFEGGGVSISGRIRGGSAPLFHQEVAAVLVQLGVGLAQLGVWVGFGG